MQANVLSWILLQRVTSGGEKQCFNVSSRDDINMVDVRCTGADVGVDTQGRPLDGGSFVLSLEYTKVCVVFFSFSCFSFVCPMLLWLFMCLLFFLFHSIGPFGTLCVSLKSLACSVYFE